MVNEHLSLNNDRFWFRPGVSCMSAAILLKESAECYAQQGATVQSAKIVSTKAFNEMNSKLLFNQILDTILPRQLFNTVSKM